jgi:hypothetical protein
MGVAYGVGKCELLADDGVECLLFRGARPACDRRPAAAMAAWTAFLASLPDPRRMDGDRCVR